MKNAHLWAVAFLGIALLAKAEAQPAETSTAPADMILFNGKVITADKDFTVAEAVAVRDGRIVSVGSDDTVRALAGPGTTILDLKGRPLLPGIVDSHTHPVGVGTSLLADVQTHDVSSLGELLDRIAAAAAKKKPGEWVVTAANWYLGQVKKRPTLAELDGAAPDNPLWLPMGEHEGFTNSQGMELAGIDRDTSDPPGGAVIKDPKTGKPVGHLRETARALVQRLLPPMDAVQSLRVALPYYGAIGVTAIGNDGLSPADYEAFQTLRASNELTMRAVAMLYVHPAMSEDYISGMTHAIAFAGLEAGGLGDDMFKVVGFKTVNEDTVSGKPLWPSDRLTKVLLSAARNKIRITIHSVCAANAETLGIFQKVNEQHPINGLRWAVIHQECATPESIDINKDLGLVINHEMGFMFISIGADRVFGEMFGGAGKNPGVLHAPIPLYLQAGVPFSLNSDGGGANTLPSIWASVFVATNRQNWPAYGGEYGISRKEAVRAITIDGAYKIGMERKIGSIEVNKLADLVVLSADPLTCPAEDLMDMTAELTILGGRIVHGNGAETR